tara:strand:+ start:148 stop:534 length:387 start_codon:yes stop_codon:yes gene_type:complete
MKIHGIGLDLVNVHRIKKIIIKNKRFKKRIFSKKEILFCEKKINKYACFAKRFAAKEAFSKALGTGISKGINFKDIEVNNDKMGMPYFIIKDKSLKIVNKILKKKKFIVFLSITDDKPYALASVTITI